MSEFPSLPLFTDAYMADAGHLSDAEHGRYMLLLMTMWRAPSCRLPNDDEWLARRFRRSVEDVKSQLRPLISEFMQTDGNWITQKRLRKEWDWCLKKREQNSEAAKSKWAKKKEVSERNANNQAPGNAPNLSPPIEESKKEEDGANAPIDPSIAEREFFERGKQVAGAKAGGLLKRLLVSRGNNVALARSLVEMASTKQNPLEWLAKAAQGPPATPTGRAAQSQKWLETLDRLDDAIDRQRDGGAGGGEVVPLISTN